MDKGQELRKRIQENSLKTAQLHSVISQIEKREHDAMEKYLEGQGDGFDLRNELDRCTALKYKALDDFKALRREKHDVERQLIKCKDEEPER